MRTELEEITESATEEAKEEKKAEKALTKEKQTVVSIAKNVLQLTCDIDDVLTYATVHNGAHIVRDICVKNISESDLDGLMLRVCSDNNLTENFELGIEKIKSR